MNRFERVLVIINPTAKRGRNKNALPDVVKAIRATFPDADVRLTETSGHATSMVLSEASSFDLVLACGGDGTVHEVAKGLVHGGIATPMAVLGMGSGNDYARALRMPVYWKKALASIPGGRLIASDSGHATWREGEETHEGFFINALGIGFDAHSAVIAPKYKGYPLGYTVAIVAALRTWVSGGATVRTGGRNGEVVFNGRMMFTTVGNAFDSGGGYTVNPGALISDGELDPCIVEDISSMKALSLLPRARNGGHVTMKEVTYLRTPSVHIDTDRGLPIHADGEIQSLQARDIEISVRPGSLRVVVPSNAPNPI